MDNCVAILELIHAPKPSVAERVVCIRRAKTGTKTKLRRRVAFIRHGGSLHCDDLVGICDYWPAGQCHQRGRC